MKQENKLSGLNRAKEIFQAIEQSDFASEPSNRSTKWITKKNS